MMQLRYNSRQLPIVEISDTQGHGSSGRQVLGRKLKSLMEDSLKQIAGCGLLRLLCSVCASAQWTHTSGRGADTFKRVCCDCKLS